MSTTAAMRSAPRVVLGAVTAAAAGAVLLAPGAAWAAPAGAGAGAGAGGASQVSQTLDGLVGQLVQATSTLAGLAAKALGGAGPGFSGPWFSQAYLSMIALGALVALGAAAIAAASTAVNHDSSALKTMVLRLPAVVFGIVAAPVVLRSVNDAFGAMSTAMVGLAGVAPAAAGGAISTTATSLGAGTQSAMFNAIVLMMLVAALLAWWAVQILRAGVLYLAVVSIPVSASASVWGGGRALLRRSVEAIAGFTLAQIPMGLAFSLAAAVVGGGARVPAALVDTSGDAGKLIAVAVLLGLGAASPFALTRLHPVTRLEGAIESRLGGGAPAESAAAPTGGYGELLSERLGQGDTDDAGFGMGAEPSVVGAWGTRGGTGGWAGAGGGDGPGEADAGGGPGGGYGNGGRVVAGGGAERWTASDATVGSGSVGTGPVGAGPVGSGGATWAGRGEPVGPSWPVGGRVHAPGSATAEGHAPGAGATGAGATGAGTAGSEAGRTGRVVPLRGAGEGAAGRGGASWRGRRERPARRWFQGGAHLGPGKGRTP